MENIPNFFTNIFTYFSDDCYHTYDQSFYYRYSIQFQLLDKIQLEIRFEYTNQDSKLPVLQYKENFVGVLESNIYSLSKNQVYLLCSEQCATIKSYTIFKNILVISNKLNQIGYFIDGKISYQQDQYEGDDLYLITYKNSLFMIQNGTIQGTVLKKSIQIKYNKSFIFDQIINNYIVFKTETSTILINLETYEEYSLAMSTNIISINSFVFVRLKSKTRQFSLTSFLSLFTQNDRTLKQVLKDNTHLMLLYNKMEIVKNFILEQANQLLDIYFVKQEESQSCQQLEIDKLSQKKTQLLFEHKILQHELIQQINQYNLDLRELQFTKARNKK